MGPRAALLMWIAVFSLVGTAAIGCAWESGPGQRDDGSDGDSRDAKDSGIDEGPVYPPGPYGFDLWDTVENFAVEKCLCSGTTVQGSSEFELADFLGAKAILVSGHAGTCTFCKEQAATMEAGLYQVYKSQGLKILLTLIADEQNRTDRQSLLSYCCVYKNRYGLSFVIAADPDYKTGDFLEEGTPLNMLLDREMVIRYKVEANLPETLEGNIRALLNE